MIALLLAILCAVASASACSILIDEAIIDSTRGRGIKPQLLKRFPDSNGEQFLRAHAFAYGGSIIQDLGYYPFGRRFYSHLTREECPRDCS
jgi:hypothetical protein